MTGSLDGGEENDGDAVSTERWTQRVSTLRHSTAWIQRIEIIQYSMQAVRFAADVDVIDQAAQESLFLFVRPTGEHGIQFVDHKLQDFWRNGCDGA